jgi:hypothetical protein
MSITQVLYIEEKQDDGTKDWHFFIRDDGDSYVLYGYRLNSDQHLYTKMRFFSRRSLVLFLRTVCCVSTSTFDITLYLVDLDSINNDNFNSFYEQYDQKYELVGYDDYDFSENSLYNILYVLRDVHVYN